jgi:hypothetical protein
MPTALEYFRMLAPEFSGMSDNAVQPWLGVAGERIVADCLSANGQAQAQALYAAHLIKLRDISASGTIAAGPVISEKEGDLQRTYAAPSAQAAQRGLIDATTYGKQYADLTAPCAGLGIMTRIAAA